MLPHHLTFEIAFEETVWRRGALWHCTLCHPTLFHSSLCMDMHRSPLVYIYIYIYIYINISYTLCVTRRPRNLVSGRECRLPVSSSNRPINPWSHPWVHPSSNHLLINESFNESINQSVNPDVTLIKPHRFNIILYRYWWIDVVWHAVMQVTKLRINWKTAETKSIEGALSVRSSLLWVSPVKGPTAPEIGSYLKWSF